MKNKVQRNFHQFQDEQDIPRGIPVGQPHPGQQLPNIPYQQPIQPQYYYEQPLNANQNQNYQTGHQAQQTYNYPIPPQIPLQINPNYNYPLNMTCSCCKCNINTIVSNQYGNTAIMWSTLICCCFGQCCCIPFLWDNCLDKSHYCPNCGHNVLRKHQRCFDFMK